MNARLSRGLGLVAAGLTLSLAAAPARAAELDGGNTAWLLTSTALVLFMTLPGLALFYGGLVRARHVLSVFMHCVSIACVVSVLWLVVGYSLAFGQGGGGHALLGGLGKAFLAGVGPQALAGDIPEAVFVMFQMTFAIITPALIVGAYPERVRFPAVLLFSGAWLVLVYAPVAHWVWGGGWLADLGVMDFAGGIVVHATAGFSALVFAVMLGPRTGFPNDLRPPHSPGITMAGAAMLWVGWFGFNAGSALAANGNAGMAMLTTHLSAAAASLTWMAIEWVRHGRPSLVGTVTGTIAGLATITPGSGFVGPLGGLVYGIAAGALCFAAVQWIKQRLKIDDSLDVFAVHGVGGALGTVLTAVFAAPALGGMGLSEGATVLSQLGVQALGVGAGALWAVLGSLAILAVLRASMGLRVKADEEIEGLDVTVHGERAYDL